MYSDYKWIKTQLQTLLEEAKSLELEETEKNLRKLKKRLPKKISPKLFYVLLDAIDCADQIGKHCSVSYLNSDAFEVHDSLVELTITLFPEEISKL